MMIGTSVVDGPTSSKKYNTPADASTESGPAERLVAVNSTAGSRLSWAAAPAMVQDVTPWAELGVARLLTQPAPVTAGGRETTIDAWTCRGPSMTKPNATRA